MIKQLAILLVISFVSASTATAQWQSVAPNLIGEGPYDNSGAMTYSDGVAWAGLYDLFRSPDKGLTWEAVTLPSHGSSTIQCIAFFDRNTGLVATGAGLFLTQDHGQTWKSFFVGESIYAVTFSGSADAFVVGSVTTHNASFTTDGGKTWNTRALGYVPKDFYEVGPGHVIAFLETPSNSHIATTTDYGATWTERSGAMDPDAHTFGVIPCDENTIFGINEEGGNYTSNNLSEVFLSTDGGASFKSIMNYSVATLSGCIAITPGAIYIPSRTKGILQSLDKGATWTTLAGPNVPIDSRDFITIDDTILLAADIGGTIWRTTNNSGAGQFSSGSSRLDVSSNDVRNDTIGGAAYVPIKFKRNGALSAVDFILHYEIYKGVTYVGSYLASGKQIDVAGEQWNGRSKLQLDAADLPTGGPEQIGYAKFTLHISEGGCADVWMDSLQFATPPSACFGFSTDSAHSIVCSNQSIPSGVAPLSSTSTHFLLSPNPASNVVSLFANGFAGRIRVRIVSDLGATVREEESRIDSRTPIQFQLEDLPAGEYFMNLEGVGVKESLSFVRVK